MTAHGAFVVLLSVALAAVTVSFGLAGLRQRWRRDCLARAAHASGMLFAADDPFDSPRRYVEFALVSGGHGARASNVTYGRLAGLAVRAFDFRYEIGHGTRRLTRYYGVVVIETPSELRPVLMWNQREADCAPLAAKQAGWRAADWFGRGDERACQIAAVSKPGQTAVAIQTCGPALLVCWPAGRSIAYVGGVPEAVELARMLSGGQAPLDQAG